MSSVQTKYEKKVLKESSETITRKEKSESRETGCLLFSCVVAFLPRWGPSVEIFFFFVIKRKMLWKALLRETLSIVSLSRLPCFAFYLQHTRQPMALKRRKTFERKREYCGKKAIRVVFVDTTERKPRRAYMDGKQNLRIPLIVVFCVESCSFACVREAELKAETQITFSSSSQENLLFISRNSSFVTHQTAPFKTKMKLFSSSRLRCFGIESCCCSGKISFALIRAHYRK